eukprot:m.105300 g.105300  ORF g.105300 m.105300 type:complete len:50 (-) comp13869_c0_seq4:480-629(-)
MVSYTTYPAASGVVECYVCKPTKTRAQCAQEIKPSIPSMQARPTFSQGW